MAASISTITGLLAERVRLTPHAPALYSYGPTGWLSVSWSEIQDRARRLAYGLRELGLEPGDSVGIMAKTSVSWENAQLAVMMNRALVVGIDSHDNADNVNHIVSRAKIKGLFVDRLESLRKLTAESRANLAFVVHIEASLDRSAQPAPKTSADAGFESPQGPVSVLAEEGSWPGHVRLRSLSELLSADGDDSKLDDPTGDDPATIVFTSGTTGYPKGLQYSHSQLVFACDSIVEAFDATNEQWRFACWLPLSNLFQRMLNYCAIRIGGKSYFVEDPRDLLRHLPVIQPHLVSGVPRFFEKLYGGIETSFRRKGKVMRLLFEKSTAIGNAHAQSIRESGKASLLSKYLNGVADALVLRRIRRVLGPNVRFLMSGSAPMSMDLLKKYHALGFLVLEAYGVSENVLPIAMNTPASYRFGSVGRPLSENEVRVAEDGEVLVKGQGVCKFFLDHDSKEARETSSNEYYSTGDLGRLDEDGFLYLIGRKQDLFKTSTGRRISPVRIEEGLCASGSVEQAMVIGAARKCLAGLVVLDETRRQALCEVNLTPGSVLPFVSLPPSLRSLIEELSSSQLDMPDYQKVAGLAILPRGLSTERAELTSNLKMKRARIREVYGEAIEELYELFEHEHAGDVHAVAKSTDGCLLVRFAS